MVLFMSHMTNEFVKTLSSSVQKEAEELGYTGDSFKIYDGKNDVATQVSQIEQAVTLGVDGIIIEPVSTDGIVKAVKDAEKAGVKVVILNQRISDQNAADTFVGADNESTGAALMKKVMEDLEGKGNIVELLGPMGSDGQEQFLRELRIRVRFLQTFALIFMKAIDMFSDDFMADGRTTDIVQKRDEL